MYKLKPDAANVVATYFTDPKYHGFQPFPIDNDLGSLFGTDEETQSRRVLTGAMIPDI